MAGLLFVAQTMLDAWADQGKIELDGTVIRILAGDGKGRSYQLEPAVRFLKLAEGEKDPHGLLRKVKTPAQLAELGAEHMETSVILGETAYEVEPGFFADPSALQQAAAAPAPPPAPKPAPKPAPAAKAMPKQLEDKKEEADLLAKFLLDKI